MEKITRKNKNYARAIGIMKKYGISSISLDVPEDKIAEICESFKTDYGFDRSGFKKFVKNNIKNYTKIFYTDGIKYTGEAFQGKKNPRAMLKVFSKNEYKYIVI